MANQNKIDTFIAQAKARLDEMGAVAKELEARVDTLDAQLRPEAENALAKVQAWVDEGEAKLKELGETGEASLAAARGFFERLWTEYEAEIAKWVSIASSQQATFEIQARAHLASWQGMVDEFQKKIGETQEAGKSHAEAEMQRLKREAKLAEERLDVLKRAGEASWETMSKGLEESRSAFEKAARQAWSEFEKKTRG